MTSALYRGVYLDHIFLYINHILQKKEKLDEKGGPKGTKPDMFEYNKGRFKISARFNFLYYNCIFRFTETISCLNPCRSNVDHKNSVIILQYGSPFTFTALPPAQNPHETGIRCGFLKRTISGFSDSQIWLFIQCFFMCPIEYTSS